MKEDYKSDLQQIPIEFMTHLLEKLSVEDMQFNDIKKEAIETQEQCDRNMAKEKASIVNKTIGFY